LLSGLRLRLHGEQTAEARARWEPDPQQLHFVAFFGVANGIRIDFRAQRDALIADENARCCRRLSAPTFNEGPYFVLRLTAERTT
jgi:hypothetical protein